MSLYKDIYLKIADDLDPKSTGSLARSCRESSGLRDIMFRKKLEKSVECIPFYTPKLIELENIKYYNEDQFYIYYPKESEIGYIKLVDLYGRRYWSTYMYLDIFDTDDESVSWAGIKKYIRDRVDFLLMDATILTVDDRLVLLWDTNKVREIVIHEMIKVYRVYQTLLTSKIDL